jgi:glutathione S-transferase
MNMKFFDCKPAPSPRRVRIFLREKGIEVPTVEVDLRGGEQLGEAFRQVNPEGTVPVLELDDGTRISEALAICVYLEESKRTNQFIVSNSIKRPGCTLMKRTDFFCK